MDVAALTLQLQALLLTAAGAGTGHVLSAGALTVPDLLALYADSSCRTWESRFRPLAHFDDAKKKSLYEATDKLARALLAQLRSKVKPKSRRLTREVFYRFYRK